MAAFVAAAFFLLENDATRDERAAYHLPLY